MLPTFTSAQILAVPLQCRKKLVLLDNQRRAAHAAYVAARSRYSEAVKAFDLATAQAQHKIAELSHGHRDDETKARILKPLTSLQVEVDLCREELNRAQAHFHSFDFLADAAAWISDQTRKLEADPIPVFTGDPKKAVAEARKRIEALTAQADEIELAPLPAASVIEQIEKALDRIAADAKPAIDPRVPESIYPAIATALSSPAFAAWAFRDLIIAKLAADIADDPKAMTPAAKETALSKIAAERLEVERAEESAIKAAEAAGITIARRRGLDPRALLEIKAK